MTRLLCARAYLLGIVASLPTLHRLLGSTLAGTEREVGYDRRALLFHSFQSLLFSVAFLVPLGLVGCVTPGGACFPVFLVAGLFVKIAVLNPWIAWAHFRRKNDSGDLELPLLGAIARKLSDRVWPPSRAAAQNAVYFSGNRPFVGYGSEINAWTLVIDTTASKTLSAILQPREGPKPLTTCELYRAVVERVRGIEMGDLKVTAGLFLPGDSSGDIKELYGYKYGRPPTTISRWLARRLDQEGIRGRQYMIMQLENPPQDLVVTQFVRFHQNAKLIFCEFASYVLVPAKRSLLALDRLFDLNPAVFALVGGALFFLAAVAGAALGRSFDALVSSPLSAVALLDPGLWLDFPRWEFRQGSFAVDILLASALILAAYLLRRVVGLVLGGIGIWLGLRRDFGIARSYRERVATRMPLAYFDRQEVIRFLKMQEKVLTVAIVECLEARGIDTSELKDSIQAFINQGIVNSGEIRGNVSNNRLKTFFSRKGRARAWGGRPAYAAGQ